MAGDEIVADWLGNVTSSRVLANTTVQRFCGGTLRYRTVTFINNDHTEGVYVGKYYSTTAEFGSKAIVLYPKTNIKFEFLDLYEMAFMQYINTNYITWLGINRY